MSKSKLKPEELFFSLVKAEDDRTKRPEEPEEKPALDPGARTPAKTEETASEKPFAQSTPAPEDNTPTVPTTTSLKKKPGPAAKPENANRTSLNILISREIKFTMVALVNELKLRGIKERYNTTDFVIEAIEEKIERTRKEIGIM